MAPRILARPIDIEFVMSMLDGRHHEALSDELRYDRGQQCRLAAAAPACDAENAHPARSTFHLGGPNVRCNSLSATRAGRAAALSRAVAVALRSCASTRRAGSRSR